MWDVSRKRRAAVCAAKGEVMQSVTRTMATVAVFLLAFAASTQSQESAAGDSHVVWIGLANGSEAEAVMAAELRALMRKYDLDPWILTSRVLIDENQIPHSHPILTIHTRHIGEEPELLSTFVHEQFHWLEEEPWLADFRGAMRDFEALFPDVDLPGIGGHLR
jgi:hypothetical protein